MPSMDASRIICKACMSLKGPLCGPKKPGLWNPDRDLPRRHVNACPLPTRYLFSSSKRIGIQRVGNSSTQRYQIEYNPSCSPSTAPVPYQIRPVSEATSQKPGAAPPQNRNAPKRIGPSASSHNRRPTFFLGEIKFDPLPIPRAQSMP